MSELHYVVCDACGVRAEVDGDGRLMPRDWLCVILQTLHVPAGDVDAERAVEAAVVAAPRGAKGRMRKFAQKYMGALSIGVEPRVVAEELHYCPEHRKQVTLPAALPPRLAELAKGGGT